jgi:hypothetical protein
MYEVGLFMDSQHRIQAALIPATGILTVFLLAMYVSDATIGI